MNETALFLGFSLLGALALSFGVYPLRKRLSKWFILTIPCAIIVIAFAYLQWGGLLPWRAHLQAEAQQVRVQALLASIKSPEDLINKLKDHLARHPESARGWMLLGKLYASLQRWQEANEAFERAKKSKESED